MTRKKFSSTIYAIFGVRDWRSMDSLSEPGYREGASRLINIGGYTWFLGDGTRSANNYVRLALPSAAGQISGIFEQMEKNAKNPKWRGCSFVRAASEFAGSIGHPARIVASRHKKRFECWLEEMLAARRKDVKRKV